MLTKTSIKTIEYFEELSPPEEIFIDGCMNGEFVIFDETNPKPEQRTIRAELIKYLLLGGCKKNRPSEAGISINGAIITGNFDISDCYSSLGIMLMNCTFENSIEARNSQVKFLILSGSKTPRLNAQGIEVKGDIFLRDGFKAKGAVSLNGATIGGQLSCTNGQFENENGHALNAQGIEVKEDIFLRDGFKAKGAVSLSGATVGGQLSCINGQFENENGYALNAQGIEVKGDIFLQGGFKAKGAVSLSGATIGGQLSCTNGQFENENGQALNAQDIEVKGDIFLRDGFKAKGAVFLSGATIGGQLSCINGQFENENGYALNAQGIEVKGEIFLQDGFKAKGAVYLSGATVGGQLSCINGQFENENGYALNAANAAIGTVILWKNVTCEKGLIDFRFTKSGVLSDDYDSWPKERFFLNGFSYETIIEADITSEGRIKWLTKHQTREFEPQPYEQLAKVMGDLGHRRDRSLILEEMERKIRPEIRKRMKVKLTGDWIPAFQSIWIDIKRGFTCTLDTTLGWFVGYGYRPSRAFAWSLAIITLSAFVSSVTWHAGDMVPNSSIVLVDKEWRDYAKDRKGNPAADWSEKSETGRDYETFNSLTYAVDVFVPIIDFGQEKAWAPSTERGWWGKKLYWLRWLIKVLGWIITALGAAAVTGIIRQDR